MDIQKSTVAAAHKIEVRTYTYQISQTNRGGEEDGEDGEGRMKGDGNHGRGGGREDETIAATTLAPTTIATATW